MGLLNPENIVSIADNLLFFHLYVYVFSLHVCEHSYVWVHMHMYTSVCGDLVLESGIILGFSSTVYGGQVS